MTGPEFGNGNEPPRPWSPTEGRTQGVFATTHWSWIVSAQDSNSPEHAEALENLCRAYWYPLYAFARRAGQSPPDAEDLTQGFFARLLEKNFVRSADQEKGRFRSFLLTAFKRFMTNEWDRVHALKRGGFTRFVPIDQEAAEQKFIIDVKDVVSPEIAYERQWALTLLERTLRTLESEYLNSGRAKLFQALRGTISREDATLSYGEIAQNLSLTEPAVKMAVHRLRARYREILRSEIARTVSSPNEVDEELRHLFSTFGT